MGQGKWMDEKDTHRMSGYGEMVKTDRMGWVGWVSVNGWLRRIHMG